LSSKTLLQYTLFSNVICDSIDYIELWRVVRIWGAPKICTTYNERIDRDSLIGKAVATSKSATAAC
jgi:hypothetical protein